MRQAVLRFAAGFLVGGTAGFLAANALDRSRLEAPVAAPAAEAPAPVLSDEEIGRARQAVDARPGDFDAQFKFAEALLRIARRPGEAVPYYERASALAPSDPRPLVGLGDARFAAALAEERDGRYDAELLSAASRSYERALALEPKSPGVRTALGLTYSMRQPAEHGLAVEAFRAALELDPSSELALQGLATSLAEQGDIGGAERALGRLEAVNPSSPALGQARAAVKRARARHE